MTQARRHLLPALLVALCTLALSGGPAHGSAADKFRMKINTIDVSSAPELSVFFTLLNEDDLPIPAKKLTTAQVYMNGKRIEDEAEIYSLNDSDHGVAIAFVACGYQGYEGKAAKMQGKAFGELGKLFRDQDIATAFAYTNNVRQLTKGKFVPGAEAQAAAEAVTPSPDAYRAKLFDTLTQAINMFQANDKRLPANRFIVLVSDGLDSTSASDTAADKKIYRLTQSAKKAGVRIMTIAFSETSDAYFRNLELLSRKSGGTYRKANRSKEVPLLAKYVAAEIWGQLAVDVVPDVDENRSYRFKVAVDYRGKRFSTSAKVPYKVKIKALYFRWKFWGIVLAIVVGSLAVLLIIFGVVMKFVKKRKKKKEVEQAKKEEEEMLEDDGEEEEEDEEEEEEEETPKKRKKKRASAKKKPRRPKKPADDDDEDDEDEDEEEELQPKVARKKCPECGRMMLPGWDECKFCAAGLGKK